MDPQDAPQLPAEGLAVVEQATKLAPAGALVRQHPVTVYLATLRSVEARKAARDSLKRILRLLDKDAETWEHFPWWELGVQECVGIKRLLFEEFGANTAKLGCSMLRSVLRWSFMLGYVDSDQAERSRMALEYKASEGAQPEPTGRMLSDDEIARLRRACEARKPFRAARDEAMLACGVAGGLRRDEIARMRVDNLADDAKSLRVLGKGRKWRTVPLPPWASGTLESWLAQRERVKLTTPSMFVPAVAGVVHDRHMSKWQVWRALVDIANAAGVQMTPHDLRRTYISTMVEHTDVLSVSTIVGHGDPTTTKGYDRRPAAARAAAVMVLEKWGGKVP